MHPQHTSDVTRNVLDWAVRLRDQQEATRVNYMSVGFEDGTRLVWKATGGTLTLANGVEVEVTDDMLDEQKWAVAE